MPKATGTPNARTIFISSHIVGVPLEPTFGRPYHRSRGDELSRTRHPHRCCRLSVFAVGRKIAPPQLSIAELSECCSESPRAIAAPSTSYESKDSGGS